MVSIFMERLRSQESKQIVVPLTLTITWLLAWLLPPVSEVPKHLHSQWKIPHIVTDWHPNRPRYNESKLALLVDTRPLPHLVPLILHMISVVPPEWRFLYLGSNESITSVNASLAIQGHLNNAKLQMGTIPDGFKVENPAREGLDQMLTNKTFYETVIEPAEHLLIFETDSIICSNSDQSLNDYLEFDFVGAPSRIENAWGGSGGLSLRKVSAVKEVLEIQSRLPNSQGEDSWFADRLASNANAHMANGSQSASFAVQSVWHHNPLGYHMGDIEGQLWKDIQHRKYVYDYCPEVKMVLDMKLELQRCPNSPTDGTEWLPPVRPEVGVGGVLDSGNLISDVS